MRVGCRIGELHSMGEGFLGFSSPQIVAVNRRASSLPSWVLLEMCSKLLVSNISLMNPKG